MNVMLREDNMNWWAPPAYVIGAIVFTYIFRRIEGTGEKPPPQFNYVLLGLIWYFTVPIFIIAYSVWGFCKGCGKLYDALDKLTLRHAITVVALVLIALSFIYRLTK